MHHFTCGISSLLYSVNLILFTLLLVRLFTSYCAHHLITVPTFSLTIYHSLGRLLLNQNSSLSQILSSIVSLIPFGLSLRSLDRTYWGTGVC